MQPGSVAVVVIYENRWVLGLVDSWRRDGARLIAEGGVSAADILTTSARMPTAARTPPSRGLARGAGSWW